MQPEDPNGGVMEEFYTDMGSTPVPAPPPPQTPPPPEEEEDSFDSFSEEEMYTDMGTEEKKMQEDMYTDMGTEETTQEEMYTDMGQNGGGGGGGSGGGGGGGGNIPSVVVEDDFYHDVTSQPRALSPPVNNTSAAAAAATDDDSPYAHVKKVKKIKAVSLTSVAKQCGYLEKLGGYRGKKWQRRFCILDDICLYFFGSEKDKSQHNQILLVRHDVATEAPELKLKDKRRNLVFKVHPLTESDAATAKVYYFRAPDEKTKGQWVDALVTACRRGTNLFNRHTILREYIDESSPSFKRRPHSEPIAEEEDEGGEDLYEDTAELKTTVRPITPSFTSESDADSPMVKRSAALAPAPERPKSQFVFSKSPAALALAAQPKSQFVPPAAAAAPRTPDPVIDTTRIYDQDNWFNYDDVYVAAWDCRAGAGDELALRRGDLVLVVDRKNADWWLCSAESADNDFRGKSGLVPSAYLAPAFELA